jgi:hypothetical protein
MQVVQALQSITQHHEFRAAYARSRPNCVVPPVEFVVGVAPTGRLGVLVQRLLLLMMVAAPPCMHVHTCNHKPRMTKA